MKSNATWASTDIYAAVARGKLQGAKKERARIRRLIGPALQSLRDTAIYLVRNGYDIPAIEIGEAIAPIDAATKPEPQRKVKK